MPKSRSKEHDNIETPAQNTGQALSIFAMKAATKAKLTQANVDVAEAKALIDDLSIVDKEELAKLENTPPQVLAILLLTKNISLRMAVAKHPNLTESLALTLAADPQPFIRKGLATNKKATPKVLLALMRGADSDLTTLILRHDNAPPEALTTAMASPNDKVRQLVANSNAATPEMLATLASDTSESVVNSVADNGNTAEKTLLDLSLREDMPEVLLTLARRDDITAAIVKNLLELSPKVDGGNTILVELAEGSMLTPEQLAALYESTYERVRLAVVKNKRTPKSVVVEALADPYAEVAELALTKAPQADIDALLESGQIAPEMLSKANASPEAIRKSFERFIASEPAPEARRDAILAYVENKNTPTDIISKVYAIQTSGEETLSYAEVSAYIERDDVPVDVLRSLYRQNMSRSFRDELVKKLPVAEQVRLSSRTPEGFNEEPVRRVDPKAYVVRQFLKFLKDNGITSVKKSQLNTPAFAFFKGKPSIDKLFDPKTGTLTTAGVEESLKTGEAPEYYVHHSEYGTLSQADNIFRDITTRIYALGFKDIDGVSANTMRFIKEVGPAMRHGNHSLGMGGNNLGWALWKKVPADVAKKLGIDHEFILIEQIQSDWGGAIKKLREEAESEGSRAKQALEDFEEKYGGAQELDKVQDELRKLIDDYPAKVLSAFLEEVSGQPVFMTGKDKIVKLASLPDKEQGRAGVIYDSVPRKFGFKDSKVLPGYLETIAASKRELRAMRLAAASADGGESVRPKGWESVDNQGVENESSGVHTPTTEDPDKVVFTLPKRKRPKTEYRDKNVGVHRDFLDRGYSHGGDPKAYPVGQDGWWSESTKEFYFAPNEPSVSFAGGMYQDDIESPAAPEQGYSPRESDSNFSVKTRPRPTRKQDKDIRLDSKQPTGEREPANYDQYTGLGNLSYPLGGALVEAAPKLSKSDEAFMREREGQKPKVTDTSKPKVQRVPGMGEPTKGDPGDVNRATAPLASGPLTALGTPVALPNGVMLYYLQTGEGRNRELTVTMASEGDNVEDVMAKNVTFVLSAGTYGESPYEVVTWPDGIDGEEDGTREYLRDLVESNVPKKFKTKAQVDRENREKLERAGGKGYNVLEDKNLDAIAQGITPVERLFTPITTWGKSGVFVADVAKLDDATKTLLEKEPADPETGIRKGEGQYFAWEYLDADAVEKAKESQVSETGSAFDLKPSVIIRRTGWTDDHQKQLADLRKKAIAEAATPRT